MSEATEGQDENRMTIIAFSGDLDKLWPTMILSSTAAASGMDVAFFGGIINMAMNEGLLLAGGGHGAAGGGVRAGSRAAGTVPIASLQATIGARS